ncbi:EAL domain-containing protein [Motiliproteus sp. MSK22-1]|uniref:EAL domain-containing protein n=1 Tax=Motiliproteus sp. MSK22-1 TaxID=1897630 RepID=UPI0009753F14|nr:EAL domain-containing protein [Motiliproteus sp. MSK22-1]OMH39026.1 hypothetical protein BGP75_04725 [Motiliproteus sp. MSK22-1]
MQKQRQSLNIIFIGVSSKDSEPLMSLLRTARLAPRAEQADNEENLEQVFNQHSGDVVIYRQDCDVTFSKVAEQLKNNNKDMPVIVLAPDASPEHVIKGLKQKASAVVPIAEKELLVMVIRRELFHRENRRRRRQAEFHLSEAEKRCRELLQSSKEAIAYLNRESQFIFLNPAFLEFIGHTSGTEILGHSIVDLAEHESQRLFADFVKNYRQDTSIDQDTGLNIVRKDGSVFTGMLYFGSSRFERTPCTQVILKRPPEGSETVVLSEQSPTKDLSSQQESTISPDTGKQTEVGKEMVSVKKLRKAIEKDQLKLLFQPVVSLRGEQANIYEVLLRLIDTNANEVSPNMFLTMLDHAEVSADLDRWVISESIRQLAIEQKRGKNNRLFINITGRSLEDQGLLQWLREQLQEHQLSGSSLIFQFSEADASSHIKHANIFSQSLKQLNASTCIKHYGSSIDSDNVLRHVPAEYVKLDGSFVQELEDPDKHEAFDKLIEPLTDENKVIVAPLVEGTNVMSKLWKSGIHYIQGFYLQAPRERMDYDFFNES